MAAGLLGHFRPSEPIWRSELDSRGMGSPEAIDRLTQPPCDAGDEEAEVGVLGERHDQKDRTLLIYSASPGSPATPAPA